MRSQLITVHHVQRLLAEFCRTICIHFSDTGKYIHLLQMWIWPVVRKLIVTSQLFILSTQEMSFRHRPCFPLDNMNYCFDTICIWQWFPGSEKCSLERMKHMWFSFISGLVSVRWVVKFVCFCVRLIGFMPLQIGNKPNICTVFKSFDWLSVEYIWCHINCFLCCFFLGKKKMCTHAQMLTCSDKPARTCWVFVHTWKTIV